MIGIGKKLSSQAPERCLLNERVRSDLSSARLYQEGGGVPNARNRAHCVTSDLV